MRRRGRRLDAILVVDKPEGPTSNAVLVRVRELFGARKAGHCGSLDPMATGMLPVCFGRATAVSAFLLDADKSYRATACFGRSTTTGDTEGDEVVREPAAGLARERIEYAARGFLGEVEQVPPMWSALWHRGRRLHELARAGETVERTPRRVRIERLEILDCRPDPDRDTLDVTFEVTCSKGTYVRTLAEDLARASGTVAHLTALRRTAVGPWREDAMHRLDTLEELVGAGGRRAADGLLLAPEAAFADRPAVDLDDTGDAVRFVHGNPVRCGDGLPSGGLLRVRLLPDPAAGRPDPLFLGLGEPVPGCGVVQPRRVFVEAERLVGA